MCRDETRNTCNTVVGERDEATAPERKLAVSVRNGTCAGPDSELKQGSNGKQTEPSASIKEANLLIKKLIKKDPIPCR